MQKVSEMAKSSIEVNTGSILVAYLGAYKTCDFSEQNSHALDRQLMY